MRLSILIAIAVVVGSVALAQGPPGLLQYETRCAEYYANSYHVPPKLVEAVIDVESNWNPFAVSPKGAVGLMQLMPRTAFALGVHNRFQVEDNIRGGVAYLAWLIRLFRDDLRLAMAAYVAGPKPILAHGLTYSSREVFLYVSHVAARCRARCLEEATGGN
ncbi:MAG: lytic transglycosylase domain-containing protein [Acidobacteria bacterium]|nr:MAG: lytic transglycosylase domain-containing protein [Acidobacteriota bacterium]